MRQREFARRKSAEASGNHDRPHPEPEAAAGLGNKGPVGLVRDAHDGLAGVEHRRERTDLLLQSIDELACAAGRKRRDVVDRLVGIELDALSAYRRHRLYDVCAKAEQAELENREEPDRACADDENVRLDHGIPGRSEPPRRYQWALRAT